MTDGGRMDDTSLTGRRAESRAWHIITCEFPPEVGGVGDFSMTIADALAPMATTHVWCPAAGGPSAPGRAVVHKDLSGFSPRDLARLGRALNATPGPRRLFVQWVPHGYGYRSLNMPFALWLLTRAWLRRDELQVMVHEPFVDLSPRPRQLAAGLIHRLMLLIVCLGASRVWTSTPSWIPVIRPYLLGRIRAMWLPVPAPSQRGEPSEAQPPAQPRARGPVVGHFGTHSPLVTNLLEPALDMVLAQTSATVWLIGQNSESFRARYIGSRARFSDRVHATGALTPDALSQALERCDVLLQPYPDGVSARRTSTLALLSAGKPVVTNGGRLTEPFWRCDPGVEIVDAPDPAVLADAVVRLLSGDRLRARVALAGRQLYARRFDVSHAVAALSDQPRAGAAVARSARV
jgi:glycosyltransferase involved in cell wall biosynthesis